MPNVTTLFVAAPSGIVVITGEIWLLPRQQQLKMTVFRVAGLCIAPPTAEHCLIFHAVADMRSKEPGAGCILQPRPKQVIETSF